ncbi:hypothetical protein M0R45_033999 [Rubus argutus]|uniref:Uncharacterized protein n=1 Tax=Rubus argutus TaxID=59490 RepID=A0AAW1VP62_RUBAR
MALRCVLGKLRSSRKSIHNSARLVMLGNNSDFGVHEDRITIPMSAKKKKFDYHTGLGGVVPARFVMEEFNKRRNAKLQFVRVLKAWWKPCSVVPRYKLTLEAVDDAGVVKFYIAIVFIDSVDGLWLESVFLIVDNERPLRQYHYLDNFFDC